jgi:hypothetical protein
VPVFTITGWVVDAQGEPIANAKVSIPMLHDVSAITNRRGMYTISNVESADPVALVVSSPKLQMYQWLDNIQNDLTMNFQAPQ